MQLLSTSSMYSKSTTGSTQIAANFSLNTGNKWIYCNGPERIKQGALGDSNLGNKCLNQVNLNAGENQLFYSYQNLHTAPIKFDIQIWNLSSGTVNFKPSNYGHSCQGVNGATWSDIADKPWIDFYKNTSLPSQSIPKSAGGWVKEVTIPSGSVFSGLLRFSVDGPVVITVYAYINKGNINGTATPYKTNLTSMDKGGEGAQYSGYGNGYFFMGSNTSIDANTLGNGKCIKFASKSSHNYVNGVKKSDLIDINNVSTPDGVKTMTAGNADPRYNNLGNWCAQYHFPVTFTNSGTTAKIINIYAVPASSVGSAYFNMPVIASGGVVRGCHCGDSSTKIWRFASITVNPGQIINESFQYMNGTNGTDEHAVLFSLT